MKITSRDIKFFVLGLIAAVVIDFAWNWEEKMQEAKEAYKEGYEAGRDAADND
jgi:hypothetical protein